MFARRILPALLALVAASGCRAFEGGSLARGRDPLAPRSALPIGDLVDRHNRNAELVTALQAKPTVNIHTDSNHGSVHGRLTLERPRNFRMSLEMGISRPVADLGSNEEELWVWTSQSREKAIYVCKYDENGEVPEELLFQPEWIIEGLGLHVVPEGEARKITEERTRNPQFVTLVHRRLTGNGRTLVKKTVVERATGAIREHVYYAGDGTTVLAWVQVLERRRYPLPAQAGGEAAAVELPSRLKLTSHPPGQPVFEMELVLNDLRVNPAFSREQREEIFAIPHIPDTQIVDVREQLGPPRGPATVRETRPAPAVGAGVRLGDPIPIEEDGPARGGGEPSPLGADLGTHSPNGRQALVGPRYPTPAVDAERLAAEVGRLNETPPSLQP
jgi:hypothetical protein